MGEKELKKMSGKSQPSSDAKKTLENQCLSCYMCVSTLMTRLLEAFYVKFGGLVGKFPWTTIILSIVACGICSAGLYNYLERTDDEFLWTPSGSVFVKQKEWISKNFPKDRRYESVIVSTKNGNALNRVNIRYLYNITEAVSKVTSPSGQSYDDLCMKIPDAGMKPGPCIVTSILDIWKKNGRYDRDEIWQLSDQDILGDVTKALADSNNQLAPLLSNIQRDNGTVVSAEALMVVWVMKQNGTIDKGCNLVDHVADEWEEELVNLIVNPKDLSRNGEKISQKPNGTQVDVLVDSSFMNAMDTMVESNSVILYAGGAFLLAFVCSVLGRFNALEQRIVLSLCGLLVIGLSTVSSFGLCSYFGLYSTEMQSLIPFLMLGIGVDDMFVIVKALDNLSLLDKGKPVSERLSLAMKHAGVSITVTSMTNLSSFMIGGTSRMPVIRSFCIFCGVGIFFLFFYSITFFTACLALDERRVDTRRPIDLPCVKPKPINWVPNTFSQIEFGNYIFGTTLPKVILKTPMKVVVLVVTMAMFGTAIYGCTKLETNYDPVLYMNQNSYQVSFYHTQASLFPNDGERIDIFVGNISYISRNNAAGLLQIKEGITGLSSVRSGSFDFWYTKFYERMNCSLKSDNETSCFTEEGFGLKFVQFLLEDTTNFKYLNDIKFEKPLNASTCILSPKECEKELSQIKASRASFQHEYLPNTTVQDEALNSVRDVLSNIRFAGEYFDSPIPYSFTYVTWTANELMSTELIRNLSINFGAITVVTILFLPNIQMVFMCLCCVAFTVGNVAGYAYFMGLTVDVTVAIIMIVSVGLAVDYCAHVAVTYICSPNETRQTKARKALGSTGSAVFNGGFSTFLAFFMVGFSDSYVFTTFFKMFALVTLFGLFHGLIFLPVSLSLIGPQGPGAQDLPEEESEADLKTHVNWAFDSGEKPNNSKLTTNL